MAVTRSGAAPNDLTQSIIGGAIEVHSAIGPGLLDRAYAACLIMKSGRVALRCGENVPLPLVYKAFAFRLPSSPT